MQVTQRDVPGIDVAYLAMNTEKGMEVVWNEVQFSARRDLNCYFLILWYGLYMQVTQRDVPGIDVAYLAMDTEEGVEVVWNEVQFSARRDFKAQEVSKYCVFITMLIFQLLSEKIDE